MVNEKVKVMDKHRLLKKVFKILIITIIIGIILAIAFFSGFLTKKSGNEIVLENPLKNIVFENTNELGEVNYDKVVEQGILEFDENYVNFILASLGVGKLHKSLIGFGNPSIEIVLDEDTWSSEINNGLITRKGSLEKEDLRISLSKQEAVKALLSPNIQEFMKNSVRSGNTQIELIANKVELSSKGYISMYQDLTGEEI